MSMAMAAVEPDLHACRQLNCAQLVAKSAKMTMKGGKDGNVGGFGVQNAFSAFPGEINQAIMTLKLGRWAVHLENVAPMSRPKSRHGKEDA